MSGVERVTMKDVAKVAHVSPRTVSNVVNDYEYVKEDTRKRVWDAINSMGYSLNLSARGLRQGNTGIIILAVPDLTMPYFADLSDAVIAAAQKRGLYVLVEPTASNRNREREALHGMRKNMADGIIYCPLELNRKEIELLDVGIPVTVLSEPFGDRHFDHVMIQNREASLTATEYLLSRGCRRIAAIGLYGGQRQGPSVERLAGYRDALKQAGIPIDERLEVRTDSWHRSDGVAAVRKLLDQSVEIDGVVAFTDQLAEGAMFALQMAGKKVPDDVAVIGFDNNDESQYLMPPLTTIDPGIDKIAAQAVDILHSRIYGDENEKEKGQIVKKAPFELIVRQSA